MKRANNPTPADRRILKVFFLLFDGNTVATERWNEEQHSHHFPEQSITLIRKDLTTLRGHGLTIPEFRFRNREKLFPAQKSGQTTRPPPNLTVAPCGVLYFRRAS